MRVLLILLICLGTNISFAHDFDYNWSEILRNARSVWDESSLQNAENDCDDLVEEIDEYLSDNEVSDYEARDLRELKKKADAMEDFIGSVLRGRSWPISIDNYSLCVSELGGSSSIISSSHCLKVIKFEYDGFVSLLAFNEETTGYQMVCKYAQIGGSSSGQIKALVTKKSVRQMTDNRENKSVKSWKVVSMTCEAYESAY